MSKPKKIRALYDAVGRITKNKIYEVKAWDGQYPLIIGDNGCPIFLHLTFWESSDALENQIDAVRQERDDFEKELIEMRRAYGELQSLAAKAALDAANAIDKNALRAALIDAQVSSYVLTSAEKLAIIIDRFCPAPKAKTKRVKLASFHAKAHVGLSHVHHYKSKLYECERVENGDYIEFWADVPEGDSK